MLEQTRICNCYNYSNNVLHASHIRGLQSVDSDYFVYSIQPLIYNLIDSI